MSSQGVLINQRRLRGVKELANKSISEYATKGDSANLKSIDGKLFTIAGVEDSGYDDNGVMVPGVKITTKESFDVEGIKWDKFHTTRSVIVKSLKSSAMREDLKLGHTIGPTKCVLQPSKQGKNDYWTLEE